MDITVEKSPSDPTNTSLYQYRLETGVSVCRVETEEGEMICLEAPDDAGEVLLTLDEVKALMTVLPVILRDQEEEKS